MFKVPYFDNVDMETTEEIDDEHAVAALTAFLALTSADRVADSRHVFACFEDYRQAAGGGWLDELKGASETAADIWNHVTPGDQIEVIKGRDSDENWYVVVTANCEWDREHGLMLVWRNGTTLTKVGGYDGHVTNEDAYDDDGMVDVVYAALDPQLTTRLGVSG